MQMLITLSSPDPEIKWNAVRLANFLLNEGEDVTLFLNGPAVDLFAGGGTPSTSLSRPNSSP